MDYFVEQRSKLHSILAASQILEYVGSLPQLVDRMVKDFDLTEIKDEKMKREFVKELSAYYPNREGKPRSSLSSYYFLLYVLERYGFKAQIFYYEFIKGIYQLEPYEEVLRGKKFDSPRKRLAIEVQKEVKSWGEGLELKNSDKLKHAANLRGAVFNVADNIKHFDQGTIHLKNFFSALGLKNKDINKLTDKFITEFKASEFKNVANAEQFTRWVGSMIDDRTVRGKASKVLRLWLQHPNVMAMSHNGLPTKDFLEITRSSRIVNDVNEVKSVLRNRLAHPMQSSIAKMFATVYAGELIDAIFWSYMDQNPDKAIYFLDGMMTWAKHAGFTAFALAAGVYKHYTNKLIPMSWKATRYLNMHGISMALGMVASDVTHRKMNGQGWSEILDEVVSSRNAKEIGFMTVAFMASEAAVGGGVKAYQTARNTVLRRADGPASCSGWFKRAAVASGRMGLVFIGAHTIDRWTRGPMVDIGLLDDDTILNIERLKKNFEKEYDEALDKDHAAFTAMIDENRGSVKKKDMVNWLNRDGKKEANYRLDVIRHYGHGTKCRLIPKGSIKPMTTYAYQKTTEYAGELEGILFSTDDPAISDLLDVRAYALKRIRQ